MGKLPAHMYANEKSPLVDIIKKSYNEEFARRKMQARLDKYGRKDAAGGTVWTVGDMQRFFADSAKRKRRHK
jgi:hypothetical protein